MNTKKIEKNELDYILGNKFSQFKTGRSNYIQKYRENIIILDAKITIDDELVWLGDLDLSCKWFDLLAHSRKYDCLLNVLYPTSHGVPSSGQDQLFASFFSGDISYVLNNVCKDGKIKGSVSKIDNTRIRSFLFDKGIRNKFILDHVSQIAAMCGVA